MLSELTIAYALSFLGTPYIWGGQSHKGVDCSGFAIKVFQAEGVLPDEFDASSQGLYSYFAANGGREVNHPKRGCLVFYGESKRDITHVAICLDGKQIIEAGGGGPETTTKKKAVEQGADVRIRKYNYRKDVVAILTTNIGNILPFNARNN